MTYAIGSPAETIDLGPIHNGDCNFETLVYLDYVGNTAAISDIGLTYTLPNVHLQTASAFRYEVTSDGLLVLETSDPSLVNQVKTIHVVVNSLIDAADTITQTFSFEITF